MDSLFINLMIITGLLIAAAYFAMSEIALAGSRKLRLTRLAEKGDKRAKMVLSLKENPGSFFLRGSNRHQCRRHLRRHRRRSCLHPSLFRLVSRIRTTGCLRVRCFFRCVRHRHPSLHHFRGLDPKASSHDPPRIHSTRHGSTHAVLHHYLQTLGMVAHGNLRLHHEASRYSDHDQRKITNEDIEATVEAGVAAGIIAPQEQTAITNVMDLESRLIPSAMTARDNIVYFDLCEDYESITAKVRAYPHSKFLVCDKTIDQIVGCVDSKELLKRYVNGQPFTLKESGLITQVLTVPDTLTLSETLDIFKTQNAILPPSSTSTPSRSASSPSKTFFGSSWATLFPPTIRSRS